MTDVRVLPAGRRALPLVTMIASLFLLAPSGVGQLPRKFDCGDLNGYATGEPGYELIEEASGPSDVTLTPAPLDTVHVAGNFPNIIGGLPLRSEILSIDPDMLDRAHLFTSLQLADNTVLGIHGLTPNTLYRVRLELGALSPWGELVDFATPPGWTYYSSTSKSVRVELRSGAGGWRTVASDIRCMSGHANASFQTNVSGIVPVWVLVRTDAGGQAQIRLSTDNASPTFLTGFELHDHEVLPVIYQRSGGSPLVGGAPGMGPFVAAFNAGDFDAAQAAALGLGNAWKRGVALTHLVGWLDGARHGRLGLLEQARLALTAAVPNHPGAAWLLDELNSLQRALDHLAASGYRHAFRCPEDGGRGFINPDCAGQFQANFGYAVTNANAHVALRELGGITARVGGDTVLDALVDWNSGAIAPGDWEPSPLVFAALKLVGTTMVDMNPLVQSSGTDEDSVEFRTLRADILNDFVDLGFAAADFPKDIELLLYKHYMVQDEFPALWSVAAVGSSLSAAQLADAWWADIVALPVPDPSAPDWANRQREQVHLSRQLADYWMNERFIEGELGGGLGDDIELMGQIANMVSGRMDQTDQRVADRIDQMVGHVLDDSGDVQDGFFAGGLTNVQHAAEYTANTYLAHRAVFGHSARAADIGLGVAERLLYAQDPSKAFAGVSNLGRVHMKSYFYTADGPDTATANAHDILLNGRSMYPAVGAAMHAPLPDSHPMVADLIRWAAAWRDDSADTSGGKPVGWYGTAQWPTNEFGQNGLWWTHQGVAGSVSELSGGVHSYTLDLLRMAYMRSGAANRWTYLVPAARMYRAVKAWEDAGEPAGPPGSSHWAAQLFKDNNRFGVTALDYLAVLRDDQALNSLVDPLGSGTTYVDGGLIVRMESWLEDEFNGQASTTKYALQDTLPCSGGHTHKSTDSFINAYEKVIPYYRKLFPLLTTHVIHTDRVSLNYSGGGPKILQSSISGEEFVEGLSLQPLVRWRAQAGETHDIAVQCNFRDAGATAYSAFVYNFEGSDVVSSLLLDEGLVPGEYLVEHGPASTSCDEFPPGGVVHAFTVQKRGQGVASEVSIEPGLNLVRVTRQGAPDVPAAAYDLALDPPRVDMLLGAGGELSFRLSARVINFGAQASPAATLRLYGSLMNPDGTLAGLDGTPTEFLLKSVAVPSLAASTGWSVAGLSTSLDLPASGWLGGGASRAGGASMGPLAGTPAPGPAGTPQGSPAAGGAGSVPRQLLGELIAAGRGIQVRAEVVADGRDNDLLNNEQTRGWIMTEMSQLER